MQLTTDFIFVYILLIHYLADFGLQTHEQAIKKSTSNFFLFLHVIVYSLIWFIAIFALKQDVWTALRFALITFYSHFVTDYITSRIVKSFWDKQDYHNGFAVIGFDQLLHFLQLWYTFKLLL